MTNALSQSVLDKAPQIVIGILLFMVFWFAGKLAYASVKRLSQKTPGHEEIYELLGYSLKLALLTVGAIVALGTMSVNVSALVASLGLTGFAITFALKDALSNIIAGLMILFYQPFRKNDHVKIEQFEGHVSEINLRFTVIESAHEKTMIPNGNLVNKPLTVKINSQNQ
jgi:small-conductance mechanosensitive channel